MTPRNITISTKTSSKKNTEVIMENFMEMILDMVNQNI
jgi:hypothetical protein